MATRAVAFLPSALACVLGCGRPARPAVAPDSHSESDVEEGPVDKPALSDTDRERLETESVRVVDSNSNLSSYAFETSAGEITQEEFIGRYHEVAGRRDIDTAVHGHSGTPLIVTGAVMSAAALAGEIALLAVALQRTESCTSVPAGPTPVPVQACTDRSSVDASAASLGITGLGLIVLGGSGLVILGLHSNREDRELSRGDAEYFVRRYNRALLREVVGPSESAIAGRPPRGEAGQR